MGFVFGRGSLQARLLGHGEVGQGLVVIVAAQSRVAARRQHFKNALRQAQDGDVKRATAEIEHGVNAFARVVEAIGNRRGGRFIDQAQHIQAGQLRGIFGGLALSVVKVSRHSDDRAIQVVVEGVLGAVTQGGQDLGTHLHRRFGALHGLNAEHPFVAGSEFVRQFAAVGDIVQATAHEALDRSDGVDRVGGRRLHRVKADLASLIRHEAHDRRQDHAAIVVGQTLGHAIAHRSHQRMGGAQVNAHRNATLVRVGRLARFGNLQ